MRTSLRQLCLPAAALAAVSLSACGGSSKDAAAPGRATAATSTSVSATPSPTPTPSPATLSKAEFVSKMEAVCLDFTTRIDGLPQPASQQDFATIATDIQGTLTLYPQYIRQADALVNRSADKARLTRSWLSVEKSDFAASEPALKKLVADVKAKNRTAVAADLKALDKVPDHSEAIAAFMSGYGLKKCAALQSS